jgi:hypothetical protein
VDEAAGTLVAREPWRPVVGSVLQGRYRLLAMVGEGAMGSVYRAERLGIDRPVAVKFLHGVVARDPSFVQRFQVEAQAMGRLSHPNCISVIDLGVEPLPYLVMDFVDGVSLRTLIDRGPLPVRRALNIAGQLLAGLAHAHAKGIVHRDVKPENIFIQETVGLAGDHVRILDFGLARLLDGASKLTLGTLLGTPHYMPPEQMRDGEIDERVDIYTAGIVLYEMLTGRKPFDGPTLSEIFLAQKEKPPPTFRAAAPGLQASAELEAVVCRAVEKLPASRFASALAMKNALEAVPELRAPEAGMARPARPGSSDATFIDRQPWGAAAPPDRLHATSAEPGGPDTQRPFGFSGRLRRLFRTVARSSFRLMAAVPAGFRAARQLVGRAARAGRARWAKLPAGRRRIGGALASSLALGLVFAVIARARSGDAETATRARTASARTAAALEPTSPGQRPVYGRAKIDRGDQVARLRQLLRQHPDDARYPAALARLSFEQRRYEEGLAYFRMAIRKDRGLRSDQVLVGHLIGSMASDRFLETAEDFLRELGKEAKPHVTAAARNHPSPRVRARARELLKHWDRRPLLQWR